MVSEYEAAARVLDMHRLLPDDVAAAVRSAILDSCASALLRLLDLGAGTGRIGHVFVNASDNYFGVDLSFGIAGVRASACSVADTAYSITAAEWDVDRTPRGFLDRQPTGARFLYYRNRSKRKLSKSFTRGLRQDLARSIRCFRNGTPLSYIS